MTRQALGQRGGGLGRSGAGAGSPTNPKPADQPDHAQGHHCQHGKPDEPLDPGNIHQRMSAGLGDGGADEAPDQPLKRSQADVEPGEHPIERLKEDPGGHIGEAEEGHADEFGGEPPDRAEQAVAAAEGH